MGRKGFTLTELLIVISILAVMAIILVGIINPIALVNKGKDARRKKDLARIKTAFEEYLNDKGCYPNKAKVDELNSVDFCDSVVVFAPWLIPWPCDPDGDPYEVVVDPDSACPNEYRAFTYLDFLADRDIPDGWGVTALPIGGSGNYGISSPNVSWYEVVSYPNECETDCDGACRFLEAGLEECLSGGVCSWSTGSCSGENCFWSPHLTCPIVSCSGTIDCNWND